MTCDSTSPLILVIDDEEALRDGCRQVLEKAGYRVLAAAEGMEGVRLAREHLPDMVFVDLKMPRMSGMEVIEVLSRDIPDMVLVMITGFATIVSAVEALQKGAYDYLPKPFSPDQLRAIVKRGLEHRHLRIEARRLKEEKELLQKNFITFVSHEMRSPLVVIRQYIEALNAVAAEKFDQSVRDIIERCSKRIQGLEEMVEHWLDISKIESGAFVLPNVSIDLSSVISRSLEEMAPLCQKKGIRLETDIPSALPKIKGDTESLVRTITNFIGNAVKFTPEGGKITLTCSHDDCYVRIRIADSGIGIAADKLSLIFEPFYRCAGKNKKYHGSGLGLTFCKKIVEFHKGSIDVSSKEGEGTTFVIAFPIEINSSSLKTDLV